MSDQNGWLAPSPIITRKNRQGAGPPTHLFPLSEFLLPCSTDQPVFSQKALLPRKQCSTPNPKHLGLLCHHLLLHWRCIGSLLSTCSRLPCSWNPAQALPTNPILLIRTLLSAGSCKFKARHMFMSCETLGVSHLPPLCLLLCMWDHNGCTRRTGHIPEYRQATVQHCANNWQVTREGTLNWM